MIRVGKRGPQKPSVYVEQKRVSGSAVDACALLADALQTDSASYLATDSGICLEIDIFVPEV